MKKYNRAIHILFWVLVVLLISMAAFFSFSKNDKISSMLTFLKSAESTEKEKIVITEVREVDWYYFIASGYSANDSSQGTDGTTATGKKVKEGMIAVDPDVIPLGTELEIKDMGTFIAEDTGGKIKGNRIDIFFNSKKEAKEFGRKGIWVKIVDDSYKIELAGLHESIWLLDN